MAGIQILEQAALYCGNDYRKDAIWAACYTENAYLVVWGARNSRYNERGSKLGVTSFEARSTFNAKLAEKLGKGYNRVEFGHRDYGNIPSFAFRLNDSSGQNYELTPENFAGAIDRLTEQLQTETISFVGVGQTARGYDDSSRIRQVQLKLVGEVLRHEFGSDKTALSYLAEQNSRLDNLLKGNLVANSALGNQGSATIAETSVRGSKLILVAGSTSSSQLNLGDDF